MHRQSLLPTDTGVGFRPTYFPDLIAGSAVISCLEIMTDDYLRVGGSPLAQLEALAERYPLVFHGVSLSLMSAEPLNRAYLEQVAALTTRYSAVHVSEHLCWTGINGRYSYDLLPFPWDEETLAYAIERVNQVQDVLQRQLVLENLTQYIPFKQSTMTDLEFWVELIQATGCGMLLDVNNVYVNSQNFGYDPSYFLQAIPAAAIKQYHLAGHHRQNGVHVDTHDAAVATSVYALYCEVWHRAPAPTILERDDNLPELVELEAELAQVKDCQLQEVEIACR
jgi:hypothetical protein